jgi:hypothetical protein
MTMCRMATAFVAAVAISLGTAATTQASTINQMLFSMAADAGTLNQEATFRFFDLDRGVVLDSSGNYLSSGNFAVGQIIRGAFDMDFLQLSGTPNLDFGDNGNNFAYGRYSVQITSIDLGTGLVTFGPDTTTPFGAARPDVMFEFWESPNDPGIVANATSGNNAGFDLNVYDGGGDPDATLWGAAGWSLGETAYNFSINPISGVNTTIEDWYAAATQTQSLAFAGLQTLKWLEAPATGLGDTSVIGDYDPFVTSNVRIRASGNDGMLGSRADFDIALTVVPVPAAAWMGFALLGALGAGRVMRRQEA